jgi:hypothetical protein
MDAAYYVAGIDVHKRMLAVVVANARDREQDSHLNNSSGCS